MLENKENLLTSLIVFNWGKVTEIASEEDVRDEEEFYAQIFSEHENVVVLVQKPPEEKERCGCFQ